MSETSDWFTKPEFDTTAEPSLEGEAFVDAMKVNLERLRLHNAINFPEVPDDETLTRVLVELERMKDNSPEARFVHVFKLPSDVFDPSLRN